MCFYFILFLFTWIKHHQQRSSLNLEWFSNLTFYKQKEKGISCQPLAREGKEEGVDGV